jgi:hypothetical protein
LTLSGATRFKTQSCACISERGGIAPRAGRKKPINPTVGSSRFQINRTLACEAVGYGLFVWGVILVVAIVVGNDAVDGDVFIDDAFDDAAFDDDDDDDVGDGDVVLHVSLSMSTPPLGIILADSEFTPLAMIVAS